jgi:septal ring factor EnvC (AmiA/AmiB activator)
MRFIICFLLLIVSISVRAQNPNAAQLQEKRRTLQKEMDELRQSLDDTRKNRKAGLRELAMMQKKISLREEELKTINNQVKIIQGNINNSQYESARLAGELDTLKEQYKKSVVYSYQYKNNLEFLNFIFSASSFNDGMKRIEYLKSYRTYREEQAAAIKSTQLKLKQKIAGLQIHRSEKDAVVDEQEKQVALLAKDRKEKNTLLAGLRSREKDLVAELRTKEKAEKKLRDGINKAIANEKEKERIAAAPVTTNKKETVKAAPVKKTAPVRSNTKVHPYSLTAEGKATNAAFVKSKGNLIWPVEARIAEHFGRYMVPGVKGIVGNNSGVTFEMEIGAEVRAVFDGEVLSIFDVDGQTTVMITHGKHYTTYSNLQKITVERGQKIEAGDVLGRSGANDYGKGQVIFMITNDSGNLNPELWMKKR